MSQRKTAPPERPSPSTPWLHREGLINGIRMHWVEARPSKNNTTKHCSQAPLIILLHGFPEFWYSWRHQITALAAAGYRVAAPDLRGYNLTEKPIDGYDINNLSDDVAELIGTLTLQGERAAVVGHDRGGAIAWAVAARFPDLVDKLIVLNGPSLAAVEQWSWTQCYKSWYIPFFQIPILPHFILGWNRAWLLAHFLRQSVVNDDDADTSLELYRNAISQPTALSRMLQYYHMLPLSLKQAKTHPSVKVPVLILWGRHDAYFGPELMDAAAATVEASVERVLLECGHWAPQELPQEVNRHLLLFLNKQEEEPT